ncbi:MAG: helix-turn-helix transcriptional regulator [Oscillospiraceae bacterium]|nr:helix-turn-helix transcriptional regulator [Oscillospiraceae bacterium]
MIRLNVLELLEKQGKTKYWLWKQLGMGYDSYNKMITNQTQSISYKNIEAMCILLSVTPNELFEYDFDTEPTE